VLATGQWRDVVTVGLEIGGGGVLGVGLFLIYFQDEGRACLQE
jgi:hypothetical protein